MIDDKKVIAIIPARKGSKGVKDKNIRLIAGKPLIAWTIDEAKKSKYIDEIYVSTNWDKVKKLAKSYDVKIIDRPEEFATDKAKGIDVVLHAVNLLEKKENKEFIIIYLQPTSPLRTAEDIDKALELFIEKNSPIVSVCEVCHPPSWMGTLGEDGNMKDFLKALKVANRQNEKKYYQLNGAIYIADNKMLKEHRSFLTDKTCAYIMSKENSLDIDDEIDFKIANLLLLSSKEEENVG